MSRAASPSRIHWIDYAKALGIALVVLGHVLIGVKYAAVATFPVAAESVIYFIYTFHMPLFFLLSGVVFPISKDKSFQSFLKSSIINIFLPYLIWNFIFALLKNASPSPVNVPVGLADLPYVILHPVQHFWFLPYLFIIRCFYWLSERLGGARGRAGLAAAAVIWYLIASALDLQEAIDPRFYMGAAFFGLGCLLAERAGILPRISRAAILAGTTLIWFVLAFLCYRYEVPALRPLAAIAGVGGTIALSFLLPAPERPWTCALGFLGEASLGIYVSHGIFAAAVRIALVKAGITAFSLHIILGFVAGMIFPIALVVLANKAKLSPYLGLGRNWSSRYLRPGGLRLAKPAAPAGGN
ncbi:acyltransferase [Xanthobacter aminoxidans]|uniref:acyltransferase family protein n=1 Tax=Xanthobacter aminoxidans TaxID=186280 RepID=UPI003726EF2F